MKKPLQPNPNIQNSCLFCIVFCTKYKKELLGKEVSDRIREVIQEVSDRLSFTIEDTQIHSHYVQLFLRCDPRISLHHVVKQIKQATYRAITREYPKVRSRVPTLWTQQYLITTIGAASTQEIAEFVASQPRYHKKIN